MGLPYENTLQSLELAAVGLLLATLFAVGGGIALAVGVRLRERHWTWSVVVAWPVAELLNLTSPNWAFSGAIGACGVACLIGMIWQALDVSAGGDRAKAARERASVWTSFMRVMERWEQAPQGWLFNGHLTVGHNRWGGRVSIPAGGRSGSHALIVGATGSGKTCSQAWIACRLIEGGYGAIAVDPKGDEFLREQLRKTAARSARRFYEWTPAGPCAYNPYGKGDDDEIAEKALFGETFTEPHYLRLAQRYVGQAVRAMRAAGVQVTASSLLAHMDPVRLDASARSLAGREEGERIRGYLHSLTDRQKRDLAGIRDRLAVLAESEIAPWLDPEGARETIDLQEAVAEGAVVYFSLEADRRPLLAQMLARAILTDLVVLTASLQRRPTPTVVLIDEFSSLAAEHVTRLFARGRSAGISLLLATQELADLGQGERRGVRDQVIGNVETIVAHRQGVPDSAELLADIAGTSPTWVSTQQTAGWPFVGLPTGKGWRRRDRDYDVHPSEIKRLGIGQALVITPASGRPPTVAAMCHPTGGGR